MFAVVGGMLCKSDKPSIIIIIREARGCTHIIITVFEYFTIHCY